MWCNPKNHSGDLARPVCVRFWLALLCGIPFQQGLRHSHEHLMTGIPASRWENWFTSEHASQRKLQWSQGHKLQVATRSQWPCFSCLPISFSLEYCREVFSEIPQSRQNAVVPILRIRWWKRHSSSFHDGWNFKCYFKKKRMRGTICSQLGYMFSRELWEGFAIGAFKKCYHYSQKWTTDACNMKLQNIILSKINLTKDHMHSGSI